MTKTYKIPKERLNELKSRLRRKALWNFIREETVIWLVIFPVGYLAITTNLTFLIGAYLTLLLLGLLRGQLWINHDAKVLANYFSVGLTENSIIYRQGSFEETFELQNINSKINKHGELTVKSKNRGIIDILLQRQIFHIPPETCNFQNILSRINDENSP